MKIFLISLGRCPDRREYMINQFSRLGWDYELVDAIDGQVESQLKNFYCDKMAFKRIFGRDFLPGELGCHASHLRTMELAMAIEHKTGYGVVVEDDVELTCTSDEFEEIISNIDTCWDVLYPCHPMFKKPQVWSQTDHGSNWRKLDVAYVGTQMFAFSMRFADFFTEFYRTMIRPIDEQFRYLCKQSDFRFIGLKEPYRIGRPNFDFGSQIRNKNLS